MITVRPAQLEDCEQIAALAQAQVSIWQRWDARGRVEDVTYSALSIYERWLHGGVWMSLETAAIHLGRLLLGALADRIGAKPVLVGGLLVQALCIATYLAVFRLGEFYALSVVFGLAYGGVMPLYAVLVREFFGARIMGTVFGAFQGASVNGEDFIPDAVQAGAVAVVSSA